MPASTRSSSAVRPDWLQFHGARDAGAGRRGRKRVRPRGDEGARHRASRAISPRSTPMPRSPTGCCSTPSRRRARRAGRQWRCRSTGRSSTASTRGVPLDALRRPRPRQCRRGAARSAGAPGVDVSSGVETRAGRQGSRPDPRLHRRGARAADAAPAPAEDRIVTALPNSFRDRPGRARLLRHLRRPLRRRDADAADPRARDRPTRRPRPIRPSRPSSTTSTPTMPAGRARSISPSG